MSGVNGGRVLIKLQGIDMSGSGKGLITNTTFTDDVGMGNVVDTRQFSRQGENPVMGTSLEDFWQLGGMRTLPTTADTLDIVSSSTSDDGDPVGTGARTVVIYGLDSNYALLEETITMNGTTTVVTSASFLRVNMAQVLTAGSVGSNVGTITISSTISGNAQAYMEINVNRSHIGSWTVPVGYSLLLYDIIISSNVGSGLEVHVGLSHPVVTGGLEIVLVDTLIPEGSKIFKRPVPLLLPSKSDLIMQAKKISGSAGYGSCTLLGVVLPASETNLAGASNKPAF